ncbi:MAG: D-cysteine desulfhydrase family protein [Acidobacteria bacterium]|nr:D-cysteine desulfhydrase family protein [Acidobacteriota bacterium]
MSRDMRDPIEQVLARYPRELLTRTPTPLHHLPHAGARLGVDLHLKREDLTDLALGGDKPRKLEYEVAKARAEGATVLVTCGSAQSNHARLTTAAARRAGMGATVVLSVDERRRFQGNLLTVYLMGADVRFIEAADHWDLQTQAQQVCEELRAAGESPYFIPVSGSTPLSCLGYVRAGLELVDQLTERNLTPAAVYAPFGTGGIFTGLLTALRERAVDCPVIGISVNRNLEQCQANLDIWWSAVSELLGRDPARSRGATEIHDEFVGRAYGDATEAGLDAILLMAETEGVLLDPVYSGKVFAGLCAHLREGRWKADQPVVMLHSGGTPALFAYEPELRAHLTKRGRVLF